MQIYTFFHFSSNHSFYLNFLKPEDTENSSSSSNPIKKFIRKAELSKDYITSSEDSDSEDDFNEDLGNRINENQKRIKGIMKTVIPKIKITVKNINGLMMNS